MIRKNILLAWIIVGVGIWLIGCQESKRLKEHPQSLQFPEKVATQRDDIAEFNVAVENYIKETLRVTKTLPVENLKGEKVNIPGVLNLIRIHKDKVVRYEGDTYFVCADFVVAEGDKEINYDFDFFMTKVGREWKLDKVLLHKIDGKPQIIYKDNKPVPVEKEKPQEELPKQEHPR